MVRGLFQVAKNHKIIAAGIMGFVAIVGPPLLLYALLERAWSGSRALHVYVYVIDTDTFEPVPNARVEVLDGPREPVACPEMLSKFTPAQRQPEEGNLRTNARGWCEFRHKFRAAGRDGVFRSSGYVDTRGTWLRVLADGRGSVLMPVDRQSIRARDIDDKTPVCVTVPLRKKYTTARSEQAKTLTREEVKTEE